MTTDVSKSVQAFNDPDGSVLSFPMNITWSTNLSGAVNVRASVISHTLTAASSTNMVESLRVVTTANVRTGNWTNAICAVIDYSTSGFVTGTAGVICGEIDMPNSTIGEGEYCVFEAEINCPTSYSGTRPIHVFTINAWGAGVGKFDDYGYLFNLTGVTSGSGHMWYDNQKAAPAVEEFIRVKTPAGDRYLGLYNANA